MIISGCAPLRCRETTVQYIDISWCPSSSGLYICVIFESTLTKNIKSPVNTGAGKA